MNTRFQLSIQFVIILMLLIGCSTPEKNSGTGNPSTSEELGYLTEPRQLTFGGRRSGEGYFDKDGDFLVFQSERQKDNPFYQIYLMNLKTGETRRISNGVGKTTCSWIHPSNKKILYASTHLDSKSRLKQKEEIDFRKSGKQKRYSWDFDENFDLFEASPSGKVLKRLTKIKGYDAEGSYSPNGKYIAFASNRHGYLKGNSQKFSQRMKKDPSYGMEIYIMNSDGTNVRRLTNYDGYDGGPFFSPDGESITWRRFSEDGHTAEVYTMNIDGSNQKQITSLKSMSWAPFYHPSGDYIVFTTNIHGYRNFELYAVDTEGKMPPVRVTNMPGFDGLPVFSPDGLSLSWSRKDQSGESQIYIGQWNDEKIRKALNLPPAPLQFQHLKPQISVADSQKIVQYLASSELKGRSTGSPEEKVYMNQLKNIFIEMGLSPGGAGGQWFQSFDFIKAVKASKEKNKFSISESGSKTSQELGVSWTPVGSSANGTFSVKDLIFAGYGIVAPADGEIAQYDSYSGSIDVNGKWVVILRDIPNGVSAKVRSHFFRYSRADYKIAMAKQRGAKGIIFISGPKTKSSNELMSLSYDRASGQHEVPVVSMTRKALSLLLLDTIDLEDKQEKLDTGKEQNVEAWKSNPFGITVQLEKQVAQGQNLLAKLNVNNRSRFLLLGAHGDHLGMGRSSSSLMSSESKDQIHHGADDNASGVAGVIEVAHYLSQRHKMKKVKLRQNVKFVIWSGEELGNLGSSSYIKSLKKDTKNISAYINMDMIGRLEKSVSIQGIGSSPDWDQLLEYMSIENELAVKPQSDPYLPTDAMSLYMAGVPIINFFTGAHEDYHKPTDVASKVNYQGLVQIAGYVEQLAEKVASRKKKLTYQKVKQTNSGTRGGFRIFLGTIPDYTQEGVKGVRLQGVIKGGPAEAAGLRSGDVIVEFSAQPVKSMYDYVYSLQVAKPGSPTTITVLRAGKEVELAITPRLKE